MQQQEQIDWKKVPAWRRPVCASQVACDGNELTVTRLRKLMCVPCEERLKYRARFKKGK